MRKDSYVTIPAWVIRNVTAPYKLSLTETMVYAIVYGFSQDGASSYYGTAQYLADWTRCSREYITKTLAKLVELGLLEKETIVLEGRSAPSWKVVMPVEPCSEKCELSSHRGELSSHRGELSSQGGCSEFTGSVNSVHSGCELSSHIYKRIENSYKKAYSGAAPAQAPADVPEDPSEYIEACRKAIRGEVGDDADSL